MSKKKQNILPKWLGLIICLSAINAWAADVTQLRHEAVQMARQGQIQQSYQQLVLLHGRYPNDLPVLYDLVEIAARAGELDKSLQFGQKIPNLKAAPTYVLEYLGKVSRNVGEYALSYRYYQMLYQRQAKADYLLGSALATSLSGQYPYAQKAIKQLRQKFPRSIEYYLAKGFLQTQQKTYAQASESYAQGLKQHPNHPELLRGLFDVYQRLGAISRAQQLADKHPKVFNASAKQQLSGDFLANRIRWRDATHITFADERYYQQQTIAQLESRISQSGEAGLRAKYDLIVAYTEMNLASQAVALYEQLLADKIKVPNYVKATVAKSYLAIQEPEKTLAIYEKIYPKKIPYEDQQVLFYAYTELRQFDKAQALIDKMRSENPKILGKKTLRIPEKNPKRIDIELKNIALQVEKGDLPKAQQSIEQLAAEAPSNADIRASKAAVASYRGWNEAAEKDYDIATNLDPNRLATMIDSIYNDMELGHYERAREKLQLVLKLRPDNPRVLQTQKEWQRRNGWAINAKVDYADNKDSVFGRNEVHYQTNLNAPRVADKWRPYVHHESNRAGLSGQRYGATRTVAGVAYEKGRNQWHFALGSGENRRGAGDVAWSHRFSDQWRASLAFQKNTLVPIQAAKDEVDGDKASASLRYRADETLSLNMALSQTNFSDDNRRLALALQGEKQLYQSPDYRLTGRVRADYTHNRAIDSASYFNPRHASGVVISLDNHWLTYARYDFKFSQNLLLEAGVSNQAEFGSDALINVRYGHDWQLNKDLGIYYYANWKTQVYDGKREKNMGFMFGFNWQLH